MRIKGMITKGEHRPVLNQFFQTRFISAWGKKKPTYFKHRVFLVSYLGLACKDIQFFCYKHQNKVYIPLHYLNVPPIHLWILQGFHTVLLHGKFSSLPQLSRQTIIQWKFLKYILNSFHGFKSPRCLFKPQLYTLIYVNVLRRNAIARQICYQTTNIDLCANDLQSQCFAFCFCSQYKLVSCMLHCLVNFVPTSKTCNCYDNAIDCYYAWLDL